MQADYTYNPQGQRIRKILKDSTGTVLGTVLCDYDLSGHLIAETDENGTPIREYLYLGEQAIAMRVSGNHLYYVHNDHLNTPRILTDQNQAKVWEVQTTPFGEVSEEITTGIINLKGFPGQYRDEETGYSDNWHRTYDPSIGRYVQSDPIGLGGGLNTYGYVGGNPLSYTDPTGEDAEVVGIVALGLCIRNPRACATTAGAIYCVATNCTQPAADALDNYNSRPDRTPEEEKQAQADHDWYKAQCSLKEVSSGDYCTDLKNEIKRAEKCATLMQQWDDKWLPGRHEGDIAREWERAQELRLEYISNCTHEPLCSVE